MKILALESSCDDTAAAIVQEGRKVLSSVSAGQIQIHAPYGGVIPENAAREHLFSINPCLQACLDQANLTLDDMDAFAATLGPGLIGSLLVGANTAKTLSWLTSKPFIGVHHLHGHIASNYLESDLSPPFLCLLVSGGHTQLVHVPNFTQWHIMGETQDDAVGEAYDKVARLLGLDFPGGPILDRLAATGNPKAYPLPTASLKHPWDFSFSGLKTATSRLIEREMNLSEGTPVSPDTIIANIAASFQFVVVETLFKKTVACAKNLGINTLSIAGGVSANRGLRERFSRFVSENPDYRLFIPKMDYCTDNAAMIAAAAHFSPLTRSWNTEVFSRLPLDQPVTLRG